MASASFLEAPDPYVAMSSSSLSTHSVYLASQYSALASRNKAFSEGAPPADAATALPTGRGPERPRRRLASERLRLGQPAVLLLVAALSMANVYLFRDS